MREMPTPGRPLGLASTYGLGPTAPYVPVLERGPQDTAHSEMMRLLELSRQQAAEIERLRAALRLYADAGFGNSTDHFKQGEAYDAAVEALGPNVGAKRAAEGGPLERPVRPLVEKREDDHA